MATASFKNGVNSVDVNSINGVHAHQPNGTRKVAEVNGVQWPYLNKDLNTIEFDYAGDPLGTNSITLTTNYPWTLSVGPEFIASAYSGGGNGYITITCYEPNFGLEIYGDVIFYLDGVEYGRVGLIQWGI